MSAKTIDKEWSLNIDFRQSLGETYTRFMEGLKEKKFLGNKIGDQTFFPPKPFCNRTYELPSEWVECDGAGTVEAFTVYHNEPEGVLYPDVKVELAPPYVVAVIRINDSDQCLLHFLSGIDANDPAQLLEKVSAGLQVKPVWAGERHGNILDVKYFEPVE
jgi:uncharacterized OB-fold protein